MKKVMILMGMVIFTVSADAQVERRSEKRSESRVETEEVKQGGFKKENLFTGGSVAVGFGSGQTSLGISPYFGYSLNKYIDLAVSMNYSYVSQRDYVEYGDKLRQSVVGPGVFTRIYPVRFLFAQAGFEENFITQKYIPTPTSSYAASSQTVNAASFLIGPGFASGRSEEGKTFFYISVLFDVAKNKNSPYVDNLGRVDPIIRTGINIALFRNNARRGDRGYGGRFRHRRD